jgi:hypothetical protein
MKSKTKEKPFYCAAEICNDPRCQKQCYDCEDEEIDGINED